MGYRVGGRIASRMPGSRCSTSAASPQIKFRPQAVGPCFRELLRLLATQSGLPQRLGTAGQRATGQRGRERLEAQPGWEAEHQLKGGYAPLIQDDHVQIRKRLSPITGVRSAASADGRRVGMARPSNVIEIRTEGQQAAHSGPFPQSLVEFFLAAFSDAGDLVWDPFLGSGTTLATAQMLRRIGCGIEISPAYCDVVLGRMARLLGKEPVLANSGQSLAEVAAARGVPFEPDAQTQLQDNRGIWQRGPARYDDRRRKAS